MRISHRLLAGVAASAALAACVSTPSESAGPQLIAQGRLGEGLALMEQAARAQPQRSDLYAAWQVQRNAVVQSLVRDAERLRGAGDLDGAEAQYRAALQFDASSDMARAGLAVTGRMRAHQARVREAEVALQGGDLAQAERLARAVLAEDSTQKGARAVVKTIAERNADADTATPRLRQALQRQISLDLRDVPLGTILEIISKTGNLNFVIDREVKADTRASIFVKDTTLDDVIRILLLTNQLERKVLNGNSLLIYPATQGKQREYQELVVRSFYLANADAKQTAAMIKALVKTRDVFVDDKLNLVIMRDTPEAVKLAEQLVATQDLGEPEVMLDLEVLEVSSSMVKEFGVRFPDQISVLGTAAGAAVDQYRLGSGGIRAFAANPLLLLSLSKQDGTTNILANPRIRVKNREKAHVHIGERVPVITTTSTANVGVSSSVNYLETGLKLDVEANVFLEEEVGVKVQLEVSNILEQLNVSGTVAYRLGTRNAATTLRLRDGETQVLAGLIDNEDRRNFAKLPYAGDLPVLGRLFRSDDIRGTKSEIVLLVTPHVVRTITRPELVRAQFPSGTEAVPGATPVRIATSGGQLTLSSAGGGATVGSAAPAPTAELPVLVTGPSEVRIGQQFAVSLALPAGNEAASATVQFTYDPSVLKLVGGAPPAPDAAKAPDIAQVAVDVASTGVAGVAPSPVQVRFQAIAQAPATAEIGMTVLRSSRRMAIPSTLNVSLVRP